MNIIEEDKVYNKYKIVYINIKYTKKILKIIIIIKINIQIKIKSDIDIKYKYK